MEGRAMASKGRFEKLMEPGRIGSVCTRNRIIKTASGYGLADPDGTMGEAPRAIYESMARGGAGLIIFEFTTVEFPRGARRPTGTDSRMHDDRLIPSFLELTDAVHKHGCPIFLQIQHSGPWYAPDEPRESLFDRISSSSLTESELRHLYEVVPDDPVLPRGPSLAELEELIETFGKAAVRAQKAGFDGVEVNGSHHHLINTFFSRAWNKRHDEYGCDSLENRSRFMCNIIREIKKQCGQDYPVSALFNAVELGIENGTTLEEGKAFAKLVEKAGADAIHVRMAGYGEFGINLLHAEKLLQPELPEHLLVKELDWSREGRGFSLPLAVVKEGVSVPVFLAGRFDAELGEEVLRQGKLDFIGMTRRLLADPDYPRKIAEGRPEDIAPCSGCLYCWDVRTFDRPIRCRINAALGRELEFAMMPPAVTKKKVLVIGGGPAGMETARVAASRGHEVTLYDKGHQLGGLMPLAALVKEHEAQSILDVIEYFKTQFRKSGITVRLGHEVDGTVVGRIKPDVIVVALGGAPTTLMIPGMDNPKVVDGSKMHAKLKKALRFLGPKSLEHLTRLWMPVGRRVVIVGGAVQGCQLAEFLVKRGKDVTIVDEGEKLGDGLFGEDAGRLFPWLEGKGVAMLAGVKYEAITDEGLVLTTREGTRRTLAADSFMTALPLEPNSTLFETFKDMAKEVYQAGDCKKAGFMHDAIASGSSVARLF
jgi:2,4-dienoyl-CoA reductase (NADPH2)